MIRFGVEGISNSVKLVLFCCDAHLKPEETEAQGVSSVQLLSRVQLFATPWTAARQASLVQCQLPEFTQTHVHWVGDAIQPSYPLLSLLLPPSIFPGTRVFSNESVLCIRWTPKYWNFSFNISPSNEYLGLISFRMDCLDLLAVQGTLKSLLQTPQFENINSLALSFLYSASLTSIHDYLKNYSFD